MQYTFIKKMYQLILFNLFWDLLKLSPRFKHDMKT
jgi:hypothetical protein